MTPYDLYRNSISFATASGTANQQLQNLWTQMQNVSPYQTPYITTAGTGNVQPGKVEKKVDVQKHHKLKSVILAIVALYLIHKIWTNREKLMARLERIIHKTAAHLGLND